MKLEILGTGCRKCQRLYERTKKAVLETGVDAEVSKVEELENIIAYGIMKTPALAIDGKVVIVGRVPDISEIKELIIK